MSSQSNRTSHTRRPRSRPAAVALMVVLVALSARETPQRDGAAPDEADRPAMTAGEHETALMAPAGMFAARVEDVDDADDAPEGAPLHAAPPAPPAPAGHPHPVQYLTVEVDGAPTPLPFMDVSPTGPVNGRAVLVLHDRDDAGDAWSSTIGALSANGFRVIVPDPVGHGLPGPAGRGLPAAIHAAQAAILLDSIGVPRVAVVGDGLGAEVAVRLADAAPGLVERLVLLPSGSAAAPAGVTLHDPVLDRPVPVLVVGPDPGRDAAGEARLDSLLLDFLWR